MTADWYCEINGEQHGPVTSAQLRQLAVARKLQPSHPVWKEGMQKKVQARTVKGLFDLLSDLAGLKAPTIKLPVLLLLVWANLVWSTPGRGT